MMLLSRMDPPCFEFRPIGQNQAFADMAELGVKPDEDTIRRVARAFQMIGQEDKKRLVLSKYLSKWKYIHFKGERVRVRRDASLMRSLTNTESSSIARRIIRYKVDADADAYSTKCRK
ncbi:Pentatricopeptide repeat-containing protein [Abeliophyllum distichum]|uniref:Pentatricopeptide repeat-containing protein n=1 Tax=Abeliophyllum distichum TaxID=126358 RepID=A0ABD1VPB9_9LAMI